MSRTEAIIGALIRGDGCVWEVIGSDGYGVKLKDISIPGVMWCHRSWWWWENIAYPCKFENPIDGTMKQVLDALFAIRTVIATDTEGQKRACDEADSILKQYGYEVPVNKPLDY